MNKLFVIQKDSNSIYNNELEDVYKLTINPKRISLGELTIEDLANVDVVISNQLPYQWRVIINGLKIVLITFDDLNKSDGLSDIFIDFTYKEKNKLFTGNNIKVSNHNKFDIQFDNIFELISKLDWDTNYWGFNIAFLSSRRLTESILYRIIKFTKKNEIRLIEYLCDCHDKRSVSLAEKNGFEFKDIRLTFEKNLCGYLNMNNYKDINYFLANDKHIPNIRELSKDIYKDSRYYFDNNFDKKKFSEFYMLWAEKAIRGEYDDECFAIEMNNEITGFCTVRYNDDRAHIGLVGISKNYSGKGLGSKLMHCFFEEMNNKGINIITVVTQGRNYAAQRLYQKMGFITYSTELWYHKWNY